MSSTTGGRVANISADNRGPLLNIASWISIVATFIIVFVKVGSKVFKVQQLHSDDYFIVASLVVAIGECIASNVQVGAGLGRRDQEFSESRNVQLEKATYAARVLYVTALYLARLGVFRFSLLMAPDQLRRRIVQSGSIFTVVSGCVMIFVSFFPCSAPNVGAIFSEKCMDITTFIIAEGIIGAVLDFFLAILPVYLLHNVHLPWSKKSYVMCAFLVRLVVIPLIVLRLLSIYRESSNNDPDRAFHLFKPALYTQIHLNISIIASCVPFLKPFTDSLQTGLLAGDLHTMTPSNSKYGSDGVKMRNFGNTNGSSGPRSSPPNRDRWMAGSVLDATMTSRIEHTKRGPESVGSRGTSEEGLVIKETVTVSVETHTVNENLDDKDGAHLG